MPLRFTHSIFILIIWLSIPLAKAQVKIADPKFETYLATFYPEFLLPVTNELDTLKAQNLGNGIFNLNGLGLQTVEEIAYFNRIDTLWLSNNALAQLNFLDTYKYLKSVDYLDLSFNNFSVLPNVYYMEALDRLVVSNNQLLQLPANLSLLKDSLKSLDAANNNLEALPNLSMMSFTAVDLRYNHLTFEDLLPLTVYSNFSAYQLQPQKAISLSQTEVEVKLGAPLYYKVPIDEKVAGNTYYWYRNGKLVAQTLENELDINAVTYSEAGTYHVEIVNENPVLAAVRLYSETFELRIVPCFPDLNNTIEITSLRCSDATIQLKGSVASGDYYFLKNLEYNQLFPIRNKQAQVPQGNYDLFVTDSVSCETTIVNIADIQRPEACDHVFTPDGDGQHDTFYVNHKGSVKIFNSGGVLIKELQAPVHWDGKDKNGVLVKPDYYLLKLSDTQVMYVTVHY